MPSVVGYGFDPIYKGKTGGHPRLIREGAIPDLAFNLFKVRLIKKSPSIITYAN
jgi:hypothetical protein